MSRIAKRPVPVPKNLTADLKGQEITVKGPKGTVTMAINSEIEVARQGETLTVTPRSGSRFANTMSGTTSALKKYSLKDGTASTVVDFGSFSGVESVTVDETSVYWLERGMTGGGGGTGRAPTFSYRIAKAAK